MISVKGVYVNGEVKLKEKIPASGEIPVTVTFLEDVGNEHDETKKLDLSTFSFNQSRELLKDYKGSLSDAVIDERRPRKHKPKPLGKYKLGKDLDDVNIRDFAYEED